MEAPGAGGRTAGLPGEPVGGCGPLRHGRDVQRRRLGAAGGRARRGRQVVIATKFPPGWRSTEKALPDALDQSLGRLRRSAIDLYQHHFPSRRVSIPSLMGLMADAVEAGKVRAIGVSNLFRGAAPHRSRGAGRAGDSSCLQPGGVLPAAPIAGGEWGAGCLPGAGDHADRLPAAGPGRPHRQVSAGGSAQGDQALRPLLPGWWSEEGAAGGGPAGRDR
jgi:hypothetical protein